MPEDGKRKRLFKDWFDREAAERLAVQVAAASPVFNRKRFLALALEGLDALEFHGRVKRFAAALRESLDLPVPDSLRILAESLPPVLPDCEAVTDGWLQWPVGQFIADFGTEHPEEAFPAMLELTKRFTSEFAVRPFVENDPVGLCGRLLSFAADPDPHVRRWCSEGIRTRLPWGRKLHALVADPSPVWPVLEALRDDPEPYVKRSVANNLNDLAKDHPEAVLRLCWRWMEEPTPARRWIVNHGLRTLVKRGDAEALAIVGYGPPLGISARLALSPAAVRIGGTLRLEIEIENSGHEERGLLLDYAVHYVRSGGRSSAKIFKWKRASLPASAILRLDKRHPMVVRSTRSLHPGLHRVELQVNGRRLAEASFELLP